MKLKIGIAVVFIFIALLFAGNRFQSERTKLDLIKYPASGKMVQIDGLSMHLNCIGKGAPTVILEAGLGESSLSWLLVQNKIALFTQVCSYDRAGHGWSERDPNPFSLLRLTDNLNQLLANADVVPPFVLVGHSRGGIYVRDYYHRYSEDIVGMVLVDSTHEEGVAHAYPLAKSAYRKQRLQMLVAPFLSKIGVVRLFGLANADNHRKWLPASVVKAKSAVQNRTETAKSVVNEMQELRKGIQSPAEPPKSLGDLPLIVLTAEDTISAKSDGNSDIAMAELYKELQADLATLSSHSLHTIVENSGHFIMYDQPQVVIDAIRRLVGN